MEQRLYGGKDPYSPAEKKRKPALGKDGKGIEICCCLCYTTGIDKNGSDGDWNTDLTDNAKTEGA